MVYLGDMLPVLLDLGFFKLYTFGVFLVLALFWGGFLLYKLIGITSYREEDAFDGLFLSLIGGLITSRIVHILLNMRDFGGDVLKWILINGYPGLSFLGFLVGFLGIFALISGIRRIPFRKIGDYLVPALLLSVGIAKVGAFFSGAELGAQTTFALSLTYAGFDGTRHLTPLYEGVFYFLGAFLAYKLVFAIRRGYPFEGANIVFFAWYTGLILAVFDPIRAFRSNVYGMSLELIVGLAMLLTITPYSLYYLRQSIGATLKTLFTRSQKS